MPEGIRPEFKEPLPAHLVAPLRTHLGQLSAQMLQEFALNLRQSVRAKWPADTSLAEALKLVGTEEAAVEGMPPKILVQHGAATLAEAEQLLRTRQAARSCRPCRRQGCLRPFVRHNCCPCCRRFREMA